MISRKICSFLAGLWMVWTGCANAGDQVADFYRDQPLKIVVGLPAGGVYDLVARHVARELPKHIPGAPKVSVQNMPGAGSLKAADWLATQAPRNGSIIGSLITNAVMQSALGDQADSISRLSWLGSGEAVTRVCYASSAAFGKIAEQGLRDRAYILGATGAGSTFSDFAQLFRRALGPSVRIVAGYAGSAELALALERGEIEGVCGATIQGLSIEHPDWRAQKKIALFLRFSETAQSSDTASLPAYLDLLPEEDRAAARLLFQQDLFPRTWASPPDVPAERLNALRQAFTLMFRSDEFRTAMAQSGIDLAPLSFDELERTIAGIREASPDLKARARAMMQAAP